MATIGADELTLVDLMKRSKPDKSLDKIVEILEEDQEVLEDIPWMEANNIIGHQTTLRAGLPTGTWRKLNAGVPNEKSTSVQITEQVGMLETYLQVDKKLAEMSGDVNMFRAQESSAAIEGLSQTLSTTLFYGDTDTDSEKFLGMHPRFDDLSAGNAENIIEGGGTGSDNSSIWLINWRPDKIHGLYSRGSTVGMYHDDLGEDRVVDGNGNYFQALVSHLGWDIGICVRDWRYIVRVANVDNSDLVFDAATGANLIDLMTQAVEQCKSLNGTPRFYCSHNIRQFLRRQVVNKTNVNLTLDNVAGKRQLQFDGVPIRKTDALTATEARIT